MKLLKRFSIAPCRRTTSTSGCEVVRLYLQSERYRDAEQELAEIIKDFPEHKNLKGQIGQLRQLGART